MDFRSPVVLLAPIAGLLLACLMWLVLGGAGRLLEPLDESEARLAALPQARSLARAATPSGFEGKPLFVVAPSSSLRLDGVSRTPRRIAALIAVNGDVAQWFPVGAMVGGYTLAEVSSIGVVMENVEGEKSLALGESLGQASASPGPGPVGAGQDQPPPGMRRGLEPASAPTTP